MKRIICLVFGHRVKKIERDYNYFCPNMILICNRCGFKENIIERIDRYTSLPIRLIGWNNN